MSRSKRDLKFEELALEAIGRQGRADSATSEAFSVAVRRRLEHGAAEYGDDAWFTKPGGIEALCCEIADEGSDLAGWVLGALQCIAAEERDGELGRDQAGAAKFLLLQAAAFGLQAWQSAQLARDAIAESREQSDRWGSRVPATRPISESE